MKIFQILAFLLATSSLFAQKRQLLDLHFNPEAASFAGHYEYRLVKDPTQSVHVYAVAGVGKFSSAETINTKVIKGTTYNPKSGSLLVDILVSLALSTPDQIIERNQHISANTFDIGGKIVIGQGLINLEFGLNTRFDVVKKRVDAWDNIAEQNSRFTEVYLLPSAGLRFNIENFVLRFGVETHKTYQKKELELPGFLAIGFQF